VEYTVANKVLVIDDEEIILRSCLRILESEGYEVTVEKSPRKAMERVMEESFGIILCDWNMSEMDGLDLVEILAERSPDSAIIMMSGYPALARATEAMRRGAVDYIAKPFSPEQLMESIQKGLRYHSYKKRKK
jgi:DNA-binding NtrC family response regulator